MDAQIHELAAKITNLVCGEVDADTDEGLFIIVSALDASRISLLADLDAAVAYLKQIGKGEV